MKKQLLGLTAIVAMAGLITGTGWAQTTTFNQTSTTDWNTAGNWDNGIPNGTVDAVIASGKTAIANSSTTPSYTGSLTLQSSSEVDIRNDVANLNVLGTDTISLNAGSTLRLRYGNTITISQNVVLVGNALITNSDNTTDNKIRTFSGIISGDGLFTYSMRRGNQFNLSGANANTWTGGLVVNNIDQISSNYSSVQAQKNGAFGTGDVTINAGLSLVIAASLSDTIDDAATLNLTGPGRSDLGKLQLNSSETVNLLNVDGFNYPAGTYGKVGSGADYEYGWIGGNSFLTVTNDLGDAVAPTVVSFVDNKGGGPILETVQGLTYTVTFDEPIEASTVDVTDFENSAVTTPSPITINSVAATADPKVYTVSVSVNYPGGAGNLQLGLAAATDITDLFGNPVVVSADDTTIVVNTDDVALVATIDSPPADGPIYGILPAIPYTVSFQKYLVDDATVTADDFVNVGTASITVGDVTRISGPTEPAVYAFDVTPTSYGTVQLEITGTISDLIPNTLTVPVTDDITYTFAAGSGPEMETITVDGVGTYNADSTTLTVTLDASLSDKLVVCVTGEHGFNNTEGNCFAITYSGQSLIRIVDRNPVASGTDTTYNDIWYLDNPGDYHEVGDPNGDNGKIVASVSSRGSITAFALSNTAPGYGTTIIGPSWLTVGSNIQSVDMFTSVGSIVVACYGMGGNGNSADPQNVNTVPDLIEQSWLRNSTRGWDGHVTGTEVENTVGLNTYGFTGGNTTGAHVIAAVFPAAVKIKKGTVIMIY